MEFDKRKKGKPSAFVLNYPISGVFVGDTHTIWRHWIEHKKNFVMCNRPCDICQTGNKAKSRWRINFVVKENGSYTAKLFEGTYPLQLWINEWEDKNKANIENYVVTLQKPDKFVEIKVGQPITTDQVQQLKAVRLWDVKTLRLLPSATAVTPQPSDNMFEEPITEVPF